MIIRYGTVLSLIRLFLFLDLDIHSCPFGAVLLTAADPSYLSRYINEGSLEHGLTADCTRRRTATLNRGINSDSSRYAEFRRRELVLVIRSCVNRSPSRRSPPAAVHDAAPPVDADLILPLPHWNITSNVTWPNAWCFAGTARYKPSFNVRTLQIITVTEIKQQTRKTLMFLTHINI